MATLENFQLDAAPSKPSNQQDQDCGVLPVHMDLRCDCDKKLCVSMMSRDGDNVLIVKQVSV